MIILNGRAAWWAEWPTPAIFCVFSMFTEFVFLILDMFNKFPKALVGFKNLHVDQ